MNLILTISEFLGVPLADEGIKTREIVSVFRGNHKLKQTKNALKESQKNLRQNQLVYRAIKRKLQTDLSLTHTARKDLEEKLGNCKLKVKERKKERQIKNYTHLGSKAEFYGQFIPIPALSSVIQVFNYFIQIYIRWKNGDKITLKEKSLICATAITAGGGSYIACFDSDKLKFITEAATKGFEELQYVKKIVRKSLSVVVTHIKNCWLRSYN